MRRLATAAAVLSIALQVHAAGLDDLRVALPRSEPLSEERSGEVVFTGSRTRRGVLSYKDAKTRNLDLYDQVAAFQGAWNPGWSEEALREKKLAIPDKIVDAMREKARRHVFWMIACRTLAESLKAAGVDPEASRRHRAAYVLAKDRALRAAREYKDADRSAFNRYGVRLFPVTYDPERWSQGLP